jgi:hypothetical protein
MVEQRARVIVEDVKRRVVATAAQPSQWLVGLCGSPDEIADLGRRATRNGTQLYGYQAYSARDASDVESLLLHVGLHAAGCSDSDRHSCIYVYLDETAAHLQDAGPVADQGYSS